MCIANLKICCLELIAFLRNSDKKLGYYRKINKKGTKNYLIFYSETKYYRDIYEFERKKQKQKNCTVKLYFNLFYTRN